jgi:hypothetical protein
MSDALFLIDMVKYGVRGLHDWMTRLCSWNGEQQGLRFNGNILQICDFGNGYESAYQATRPS